MAMLDRGYGPVTREERRLPAFERILLDGAGRVDVAFGDAESVIVEAASDLLPYVETDVDDGTLSLRLRAGSRPWLRAAEIRFAVTTRTLHGVSIDGAGAITLPPTVADPFRISIDGAGRVIGERIQTGRLDVSIDGAGHVDLADAEAADASISIDGAGVVLVPLLRAQTARVSVDGKGRVTLAGGVERLAVTIDGTGDVDAQHLPAKDVRVAIDGVGKVRVKVEEVLDVRIDGFGRVEYAGDPKIQKRELSGSGKVVRIDEAGAA